MTKADYLCNKKLPTNTDNNFIDKNVTLLHNGTDAVSPFNLCPYYYLDTMDSLNLIVFYQYFFHPFIW